MKTMCEQVFHMHCNGQEIKAGDIVFANVDLVVAMDTSANLRNEIEQLGLGMEFSDRLAIIFDHHVPANNVKVANMQKEARLYFRELKNYFEIGRGGICHLVVPEAGLCHPGDLIIGTDSHTCTYGAFGAFSTGMGFQDAAVAVATGKLWFRVPESFKIVLHGQKGPYVQGKDIILTLLGLLGVDGAIYKSLEFTGPALKCLDISDRFTICNMAVETGAKTGMFETDDVTEEYFKKTHGYSIPAERILKACDDAAYERTIHLDISKMVPMVALPNIPSNVKPAADVKGVKIDQAFIGSCSNGRIEDMRMAAAILKDKKISDHVRLIVLPGSQKVMKEMADEGLVNIFIDANAIVGPPTCGPCSGNHLGILADGEVCISGTNRNFTARMGSPASHVYLANPAVVAASAVKGEICSPEEVMKSCRL